MHPLVVIRPALATQQPVGHPPSPADLLSRDLAVQTPELGLLDINDFAAMVLDASVLTHHAAGEPLGDSEEGAQDLTALRRLSG